MWLSKVPATPHAGGRLSRPAKAPLQARAATQRHADRKGAAAPYADAAINRFQQGTLVSTLFTPTTCAAFQRLAGPERSLLTRRRKAAAAAAPARVVAQRSNTPHGRGLTVKVMASQQDEVIAPGGTMEDVFATLAQRTLARAGELQPGAIYMVGIAGVPGAGKSTTAVAVCREINRLHAAGGGGGDLAVVVPMDGFHYYRRQLDAMNDPVEAHARRGAPFTFDAPRLLACLKDIRAARGEVRVPSFDHAEGDPVEDAISVQSHHRVVLVEGNYLLLEEPGWAQMRALFDEAWFVDCSVDAAMERVLQRQVDIGAAPEVAKGRIAGNDRPNAELIMSTKPQADLIVPSLPL
mmetsp:Transcript_66564/g.210690  ORF Transcript_66564/g.210690 Transcript_66564/m.210690 type:complete len:351 (-) Transcript_66564:259-1311(-)